MKKNIDQKYSLLFNDFVNMVKNLDKIKVPKGYVLFERKHATEHTKEDSKNEKSE